MYLEHVIAGVEVLPYPSNPHPSNTMHLENVIAGVEVLPYHPNPHPSNTMYLEHVIAGVEVLPHDAAGPLPVLRAAEVLNHKK